MPLYLLPSHAYDRSAIMRAAWRLAHKNAVAASKPMFHIKARPTTARAEFPAALKRIWGNAKSERSYAEWCVEHDARAATEAVRRAALPLRDRQIEDARYALMMAEHADRFTVANNAAIAEARATLRSLQSA